MSHVQDFAVADCDIQMTIGQEPSGQNTVMVHPLQTYNTYINKLRGFLMIFYRNTYFKNQYLENWTGKNTKNQLC